MFGTLYTSLLVPFAAHLRVFAFAARSRQLAEKPYLPASQSTSLTKCTLAQVRVFWRILLDLGVRIVSLAWFWLFYVPTRIVIGRKSLCHQSHFQELVLWVWVRRLRDPFVYTMWLRGTSRFDFGLTDPRPISLFIKHCNNLPSPPSSKTG